MAANKPKIATKQIEKEIDGVVYTLRQATATEYFEFQDTLYYNGKFHQAEYIGAVLDACVVNPTVTLNDFTGKTDTVRKLRSAIEALNSGKTEDEVDAEDEDAIKNI